MGSERLLEAEWAKTMGVQVLETQEMTCHVAGASSTRVDYLLRSREINLTRCDAQINKEAVLATHDAVDFHVQAEEAWPLVKVLEPGPRLPTARPIGPTRQVVGWQQVGR